MSPSLSLTCALGLGSRTLSTTCRIQKLGRSTLLSAIAATDDSLDRPLMKTVSTEANPCVRNDVVIRGLCQVEHRKSRVVYAEKETMEGKGGAKLRSDLPLFDGVRWRDYDWVDRRMATASLVRKYYYPRSTNKFDCGPSSASNNIVIHYCIVPACRSVGQGWSNGGPAVAPITAQYGSETGIRSLGIVAESTHLLHHQQIPVLCLPHTAASKRLRVQHSPSLTAPVSSRP